MKSRKIVVFLGPSLDRDVAQKILKVDYRPPAKRGDVFKAAKDGAKIIGLIDGVFFQDSAVAHKEVLHVLEMGAKVIGASSMGALRASELYPYGMEGVGRIYECYKDGTLISDDEVALIFDPISFKPLSEPLVNVRHHLDKAKDEGIFSEDACKKVLEAAVRLYFPQRTYSRILDDAGLDTPSRKAFLELVQEGKNDLKRKDAIMALERIKEMAESL